MSSLAYIGTIFLVIIIIIIIIIIITDSWASEASPTLGCSIEISRDIHVSVCMSTVCKKCVGGITWPKDAHAQSQPVTPVLFITTIR